MEVFFTEHFKKKYKKLPQQIKKVTQKQLGLLIPNPHHPSLNVKKMQDPRNIWEARITEGHRMTFQIEGEVYILRNIGTHDILHKPVNPTTILYTLV